MLDYGSAIRQGFEYLLNKYPECFIMGQGLWSPWYVGNTMTDLDTKFGKSRVIDTPVSESGITGLGVGAAIAGLKPIIVHPRMDFMLYGMDAIVNEAAKWHSMTGGKASAGVTIRAIINRGGEQGAQHSQALHAWFMHIPGIRVVMPYSVKDARDLLISSVLSPDPVLYIDDRWLYSNEAKLSEICEYDLNQITPQIISAGNDFTIVAAGYSVQLAIQVNEIIKAQDFSGDIFDLRVLNPLDLSEIVQSVSRTGRLIVIDGGWGPASLSSEVIAGVVEKIDLNYLTNPPARFTLPFAPAPSGRTLEEAYYPKANKIAKDILEQIENKRKAK